MAVAQAVVPENDDKEDDDRDTSSNTTAPLLQKIKDEVASLISKSQYGKLEESLEAIKSTKLLIAVIGTSCAGKSSFINNMLGLKEGDEGAAPIGDGHTTKEPTEFSNPKNNLLVFMDLPGYGTPDFDQTDEYLERIKVDTYDFFLIFYRGAIIEDDVWIIEKLRTKKKKFALVRARADDMNRERQRKSLQERIDGVKLKTRENLGNLDITDKIDIFVISNKYIKVGDFDELFNFIETSLPDIKRMAIVIHAYSSTEKIITKKKDLLLKRAWIAAAGMGIATGIPIPGIDIPINIAVLVKEIHFYLQSFGLTDDILDKFPAEIRGKLTTANLIRQKGIKGYILLAVAKAPFVISTALAQQAIETIIPIVGSIITGSLAFSLYVKLLRYVINELATDAEYIRKHHIDSVV